MESLPLKYLGYGITLQEVPNEVSLVINVSGCPHKCEGCHSQYLWDYDGYFIKDDLVSMVQEYNGMISCVCFMGGEQNLYELLDHLVYIKSLGLKTCLYTGCSFIDDLEPLLEYLDWVKIGSYKEKLTVDDNMCYGVKLATSNQKLLKKGIDF